MSKKKIKISIITPVLNGEKTILKNIKSVKVQNYNQLEHIIIDGKSKDQTIKIINAQKYRSLKIISEKDTGIYQAINKGISLAKGSIIGILNADDFYSNTKVIKNIANIFAKKKTDILFTNVKIISNKESPLFIYSCKNFLLQHLLIGLMPPHPGIFVHKKIYKKYGLFDVSYKVAADFEFLLRILHKKPHIQKLEIVSVCMRLGGASTKNIFSKRIINMETKKILNSYGFPFSIFTILKKYYIKVFKYYIPIKRPSSI